MTTVQNDLAKKLRALHVPGSPLVLTNVYDAATAAVVCDHRATRAIATASYAIAATTGVDDNDLTLAQNLAGIRKIASVVSRHAAPLPLTADLQDGYDIETAIPEVIAVGAVGCNIEDVDNRVHELRSVEDAVSRVKRVLAAAKEAGVPDFCVNARTDVLLFGGSVEDAVERGKAYLEAGANTVFVWGGSSRGLSKEEVKILVERLGGMVNVKMNLKPGFLGVQELSEIGVARISVGPELFHKAMKGYRDALMEIVEG